MTDTTISITDEAKAPKAKAKKPAAKKATAKAKDATKVDQIIKLAQRAKGVTRSELVEISGWTKCPWKWSFSNPQGTGWCDKRKLKLRVVKDDNGIAHYHVSK